MVSKLLLVSSLLVALSFATKQEDLQTERDPKELLHIRHELFSHHGPTEAPNDVYEGSPDKRESWLNYAYRQPHFRQMVPSFPRPTFPYYRPYYG
ncbi:hypothetical protein AAVH_27524 [Aphelenchoides avenae]|nr:hypothetical protein AAVH_27524 [Aphelenchus avenae]